MQPFYATFHKTSCTNRWCGWRFTTGTGHIGEFIPEYGDAFHLQVFMCKCGWLMHINIWTLLACFIAVNNPASNHRTQSVRCISCLTSLFKSVFLSSLIDYKFLIFKKKSVMDDGWCLWCLRKAHSILSDHSHPARRPFSLLTSGKHYGSMAAHATKPKSSIYLQAIRPRKS